MASIFARPATSSSQPSIALASERERKRKRTHRDSASDFDQAPGETSYIDEYAAVLSPDERAQRRLAGYSLIDDLPPAPFPHKKARSPKNAYDEPEHVAADSPTSLRLQHLSAITAVLHKSLLRKDYARARRALGLILRTDVNGKPVDIRTADNWAVGAEILFRQQEHCAHEAVSRSDRYRRLQAGFLQAKSLYEMLIIQYPHHRAWPDHVNAVDFYLAMFSLWVYVAQAEDHDDTTGDPLETKLRQLDDANDILMRMDRCMLSAPYGSNPDLFRLRAMVAEWHALLTEDCQNLTPSDDSPVAPSQMLGSRDGIATHVEALSLDDSDTNPP